VIVVCYRSLLLHRKRGCCRHPRNHKKHNPNYKLNLNTNYLPRPRGTTAISFEELNRFAPSVMTSQPIAGVSNRHSLSSHFLNPRTSLLSQRVRLRKVKYYCESTPVLGDPKNSTGDPATMGPLETARSAEGPGFPRPSGCLEQDDDQRSPRESSLDARLV